MFSRNSILPRTGLNALLIAGLCLFSACAFKNEGEKPVVEKEPVKTETVLEAIEREKAKEAANGVLTAENTKLEFVENPQPGSYQMIVRWPTGIKSVALRVNDGQTILKNNVDFAEVPVASGENYKIELIAYGSISTAPISMFTVSSRAPVDIILKDVSQLKEDQTIKANRLYFMNGARIETRGYILKIDVNKIYVEEEKHTIGTPPLWSRAHIRTFPLNAPFEDPRQLNGSSIFINAKEAHGELRVALIGVNGTKGADGLPLASQPETRPNPPAPESLAGQDGKETNVPGNCNFKTRGTDYCADPGGPRCTTLPGSGQKGIKGAKGAKGEIGGTGGGAGTLELNIENHVDFRVRVVHQVGSGGPNGKGGRGGRGTLGGRPGAQPGLCSSYPVSPGPVGDDGDPGESPEGSGPSGSPVVIRGNGVRVDSEGP